MLLALTLAAILRCAVPLLAIGPFLHRYEPGASGKAAPSSAARLGAIPLQGSTLREVVDPKHPFRFQVNITAALLACWRIFVPSMCCNATRSLATTQLYCFPFVAAPGREP